MVSEGYKTIDEDMTRGRTSGSKSQESSSLNITDQSDGRSPAQWASTATVLWNPFSLPLLSLGLPQPLSQGSRKIVVGQRNTLSGSTFPVMWYQSAWRGPGPLRTGWKETEHPFYVWYSEPVPGSQWCQIWFQLMVPPLVWQESKKPHSSLCRCVCAKVLDHQLTRS